jgi:hypothetical protein
MMALLPRPRPAHLNFQKDLSHERGRQMSKLPINFRQDEPKLAACGNSH